MGIHSRFPFRHVPEFIVCGPPGVRRRSLRSAVVGAAALLLMATPAPAADSADAGGSDHPAWEKSGDILQWGIPLVGLGLSFLLDGSDAGRADDFTSLSALSTAPGLNWPGPRLADSPRRDFLISFLRMEVATYSLKYGIDAKRPNGGGQSFPSGHTAAAFMGAEFIRKHYGQGWGAPAYVAAGWVGYTRVQSHNHYWRDVIGGALVGVASNFDFDAIDTPIGQLSFGPAAFAPLDAAWPGDDASRIDIPTQQAPSIPGLRFELRF